MDKLEKAVLRKNHRLLVDSLDLSGTDVLDKLQQDDVISADEQEDILGRETKKDQNARLLFILKRINASKQPFDSLVRVLDSNHGFISAKLKRSYIDLGNSFNLDVETKCFYCQMIDNLIPKYVSHYLYEDGIISDDDLEETNNSKIPRKDRVVKLLKLLEVYPDRNYASEILCRSLQQRYSYLLTRLGTADINFQCTCCSNNKTQCPSNRTGRESLSHSTEREQTLTKLRRESSKHPSHKAAKCLPMREKDFLSSENVTPVLDSQKCLPEQKDVSLLGQKFTSKESTESMTKRSSRRSTDALSEFKNRNKDRLLKCKHLHGDIITFSEKKDYSTDEDGQYSCRKEHPDEAFDQGKDEIDSSIKESPSLSSITKVVSKTSPNDRRLMTLCAKLWEKLFYFREEGSWDTFHLFSGKAIRQFAKHPDVVVSLYRSEMAVSTFYIFDQEKANGFYEKAIEVIPRTTMPTWHLGRLLPLKMILLSKERKFEEASNLCEESQQTVATLGPGLSTGCANFFEALYLESILRCTRSDTKSAFRLSERVKQCFLTAIDHYQEEPFFPMQSFLNQVYLFLALFSLGVDLKYSSYLNTVQVKENDIKTAEHYLNLFENGCWEQSTNWSRMLFFIARGELHKHRKNFRRSIDYFKEALTCAVSGGYTDQMNFIDENINTLEERQSQKTMVKPRTDDVDGLLREVFEGSGE